MWPGLDAGGGATEAPTIFVVDDTPVTLEFLRGILAAEGFRTLSASDGPAARRAIAREQPDLILLDVLMPGESGFETCARLKSDPATADIPILFLSSLDDVKNKVVGLKIGGVDYIAKPVQGEEVLARVRVHLRIRATNRALVESQKAQLSQLREAQRAILVRPEDCSEAEFAVYYRPVEEAGGDFYDVIPLAPGMFAYFVADISGHGAGAAFLTSAVKALLRQYSGPMYSAEETLRGVNSVMAQVFGDEQYLTACYARLNRVTRRLTLISAGHPPPILVSRSGAWQKIELDSDPLGLFGAAIIQRRDLRVSTGDRLFIYTDGLIESSAGGGRRAGLDLLVDACLRTREQPLTQAVRDVAEELRPDGSAEDDLLLLGVEVN